MTTLPEGKHNNDTSDSRNFIAKIEMDSLTGHAEITIKGSTVTLTLHEHKKHSPKSYLRT